MLSKTEQVWRHLLVGSFELGKSRHASLTVLATELGLGVSTVHKALQRPAEMGALQIRGAGGVRVIDPSRLLLLWAGHRNLRNDVLYEEKAELAAWEVERVLPVDRFVLGGFGAVVSHEGGNFVSGYDRVLCYGSPRDLPKFLKKTQSGETVVMVLEPDPLLNRYGRVTPLSQAYTDLFNVPGWPAARFISALSTRLLDFSVA